jgi:hypothetical protein
MLRATVILLFSTMSCLLCGCSSGSKTTFDVKGTVTFDGKLVPAGRIDFYPDFTQGNDGPQGFAIIKDGVFDTSKPGGQGHAGGAMLIKVEGFDGKSDNPQFFGTPIFRVHEFKRELSRGSSVENFEVPASAAEDFTPTKQSPT